MATAKQPRVTIDDLLKVAMPFLEQRFNDLPTTARTLVWKRISEEGDAVELRFAIRDGIPTLALYLSNLTGGQVELGRMDMNGD